MQNRNAVLLLVMAFAMSCSPAKTADYPLIRQYPGELPPDITTLPESAKPKKHLELAQPEGWEDITKIAPSPEGTIVVYGRSGGGDLAVIAVHGSVAPKGETMANAIHRVATLVTDAHLVSNVDSDDPHQGSFDWASGSGNSVGHGIVLRLEDAPGFTIAILGFGTKTSIENIKDVMEDLADSAEIADNH